MDQKEWNKNQEMYWMNVMYQMNELWLTFLFMLINTNFELQTPPKKITTYAKMQTIK
jgi:hypothetical protein